MLKESNHNDLIEYDRFTDMYNNLDVNEVIDKYLEYVESNSKVIEYKNTILNIDGFKDYAVNKKEVARLTPSDLFSDVRYEDINSISKVFKINNNLYYCINDSGVDVDQDNEELFENIDEALEFITKKTQEDIDTYYSLFFEIVNEDFGSGINEVSVKRTKGELDEQDAINFAKTIYPDREFDCKFEFDSYNTVHLHEIN